MKYFPQIFFMCVLAVAPVFGQTLRDQEIAQCLPGEISTWPDGRDQAAIAPRLVFVYDHRDAPQGFSEASVMEALSKATAAWAACGIPGEVRRAGASGAALSASGKVIPVRWSVSGSQGHIGAADRTQGFLWLGPAPFAQLRLVNPGHDALSTLQMVISHEMGHLFGVIAHSRRCVDVTSYYHDGNGGQCSIRGGLALPPGVEYRAVLPTACDIARCRAANGFPIP